MHTCDDWGSPVTISFLTAVNTRVSLIVLCTILQHQNLLVRWYPCIGNCCFALRSYRLGFATPRSFTLIGTLSIMHWHCGFALRSYRFTPLDFATPTSLCCAHQTTASAGIAHTQWDGIAFLLASWGGSTAFAKRWLPKALIKIPSHSVKSDGAALVSSVRAVYYPSPPKYHSIPTNPSFIQSS